EDHRDNGAPHLLEVLLGQGEQVVVPEELAELRRLLQDLVPPGRVHRAVLAQGVADPDEEFHAHGDVRVVRRPAEHLPEGGPEVPRRDSDPAKVTASPATRGSPGSVLPGRCGNSRKNDRAVTLLPPPVSPTIPSVSPWRTSRSIPSRAFTTP